MMIHTESDIHTYSFNKEWKFYKGDAAGAEQPGYNDAGWRRLDVPHDWGIEGPFDRKYASSTGFLPGGIGWYRKSFQLPEPDQYRKVLIRFDGIYKNSEVWINGQFLGKRPYGYSSFTYDLSPNLFFGGRENVIAVKVDHSDFADSRWYTGSGICRPVWLQVCDPLFVKPDGIFVTTPRILGQKAAVHIETAIQNDRAQDENVQVFAAILNQAGQALASAQTGIAVRSGMEAHCELELELSDTVLWSVRNPHLYQAEVRIVKDGETLETRRLNFGVRYFRFDADTGFSLNGEPMKFKGVCVHHDAGSLGAAVPKPVWRYRLELLKEAGCNAIRTSHNPPDPELLDLCDEMGFLVMDEAFDEWALPKKKWVLGRNVGDPNFDGYARDFAEWSERDLQDMILRDRNHPSIIFWNIGNEIDYPNDPYSHPMFEEHYEPDSADPQQLGEIAEKLAAAAREADPTRPVTAALACVPMSNTTSYPDALDVAGYNYQEKYYEADHEKYPQRIIYGSENGHQLEAWLAVEQNAYISGQFLWTGIDYLGEAGEWPNRNSRAGLLDLAGFKKPLFYYRQSLWSEQPMVCVGVKNTETDGESRVTRWRRDVALQWEGKPGEPKTVVCCSTCEQVELFLNDQSLGVKNRSDYPDRSPSWEVPYQTGVLKAVGIQEGRRRCSDELRSHGLPHKLNASLVTGSLNLRPCGIALIEIQVTDEEGVHVPDAGHDVRVQIEGPGELLGLESGDADSQEDYKANHRRTFHGRLLAYVKAAEEQGSITLQISSSGLQPAVLELNVTP